MQCRESTAIGWAAWLFQSFQAWGPLSKAAPRQHVCLCRELPTVIRGIGINPSEQQMAEIVDLVRAVNSTSLHGTELCCSSADNECRLQMCTRGHPHNLICWTRVQIKEGMREDSQLVMHERFQEVVVPWIMQHEAQLVREGFHRIMRAFRALDPERKGYIDAQVLKTTLMTQVRREPAQVMHFIRTQFHEAPAEIPIVLSGGDDGS